MPVLLAREAFWARSRSGSQSASFSGDWLIVTACSQLLNALMPSLNGDICVRCAADPLKTAAVLGSTCGSCDTPRKPRGPELTFGSRMHMRSGSILASGRFLVEA